MVTRAATVQKKRIAILQSVVQSLDDSFKPHCFGVFCIKHSQCQRYNAIDGSQSVDAMAYCSTDPVNKPAFIQDEKN